MFSDFTELQGIPNSMRVCDIIAYTASAIDGLVNDAGK